MGEMTREAAITQLTALREKYDTEAAHEGADEVLCELLVKLGYDDVVEAWRRVDKWYA